MINYSNAIWQATDEIIEADGFGDYKRKNSNSIIIIMKM